MPEVFMNTTLKYNLALMSQATGYEHIIWTNIPDVVSKQAILAGNVAVKVESIHEHKDDLRLYDLAIEVLKYSVGL